MAKENNNRSLFLYTSLIFIVAIIMILVAFFGQNNLQKNQPIQSDAELTSITEKAAELSEDNRILLEENQKIIDENTRLTAENTRLAAENENVLQQLDSLSVENKNNQTLIKVYELLYKSQKKDARKLLQTIIQEELTEEQKYFYNILFKKTK